MSAVSTATPTQTSDRSLRDTRLSGGGVVLLATAGGILLNVVMELVHAVQLPELRPELGANLALVVAWSLAGGLIAYGLVRLGRRIPTAMAWVLAVVGLATAVPLFWAAVPASLASGAYALPGRSPAHRGARVVALIAMAAYVVTSVSVIVRDAL